MKQRRRLSSHIDLVHAIPYTSGVTTFEVLATSEFDAWLSQLPPKTRTIVLARLDMLSRGHFGDHKRFEGLIELRWKNGIRIYAFFWGASVVVSLYGGNKNGQDRDIKKAKRIRDEVLEGTRPIFKPGTP